MTSLVPRPPYSDAELEQIFPPNLALQQVQIFFRHGERTPITSGFNHLGLFPFWPLCDVTQKLYSTVLTSANGSQWTNLPWQRRLETIRGDGGPMPPKTANGTQNNICAIGELTDIGRRSMLQLGQRLRHLYVKQLRFMPEKIEEPNQVYLRASTYTRAQESTHQAFLGLYPPQWRASGFVPHFVLRLPKEETLMPNEDHCARFIQMMAEYSQKAARKWNGTGEMKYLNKNLARYMPSGQTIAVDSKPRISQIYDAVNSTLASGDPLIKLPQGFYDPAIRKILDKIAYDEEWGPWHVNQEYRKLGIGALLGDIVERMMDNVDGTNSTLRMALSGGHDSTVIGIMASLDALEKHDRVWPPYSTTVSIELFRHRQAHRAANTPTPMITDMSCKISRTQLADLTESQKEKLRGYYVRVRYNDRPVTVPHCKKPGKHLDGDASFCTLAAFKEIIDDLTPRDWKKSCLSNLGKPVIPETLEQPSF